MANSYTERRKVKGISLGFMAGIGGKCSGSYDPPLGKGILVSVAYLR